MDDILHFTQIRLEFLMVHIRLFIVFLTLQPRYESTPILLQLKGGKGQILISMAPTTTLVSDFDKQSQVAATSKLSRLLEYVIVIVACILAFLPRLLSVIRYEAGLSVNCSFSEAILCPPTSLPLLFYRLS